MRASGVVAAEIYREADVAEVDDIAGSPDISVLFAITRKRTVTSVPSGGSTPGFGRKCVCASDEITHGVARIANLAARAGVQTHQTARVPVFDVVAMTAETHFETAFAAVLEKLMQPELAAVGQRDSNVDCRPLDDTIWGARAFLVAIVPGVDPESVARVGTDGDECFEQLHVGYASSQQRSVDRTTALPHNQVITSHVGAFELCGRDDRRHLHGAVVANRHLARWRCSATR